MSTETSQPTETETSPSGRSTVELVRFGIFYLALAVAGLMTVLFLRDLFLVLGLGWTEAAGAELGIHRLHIMGIATVVTVFLLGLFVQAYKPQRRVAAMWGALITMTVVTLGTLGFGVGRPEEVIPFMVITGVAVLAHPAGRDLLTRGESFSPALLALLAVAVVPLLAFIVNQYSLTTVATDPHAAEGHYVMMAGLMAATLAYGIVAALGVVGWRLAAWLAALPMAYYGLLSIAFPAQAGSTGALWGAAAILWAIAFVAVAEYSRVSTSTSFRRPVARAN